MVPPERLRSRSEHRKRDSERKHRFFPASGLERPQEDEAQALGPFLPNEGKHNPHVKPSRRSSRNLGAANEVKNYVLTGRRKCETFSDLGSGATSTPPRSV